MLVLSRKLGQSVEFPGLGIVVRVNGVRRSRVQLGIQAPSEVAITRSELAFDPDLSAEVSEVDRIRDELARVEAEVAALAELADSDDQQAAQRVAAESVQRIRGIRRSLNVALRETTDGETPIADLVGVRGDVAENLRRQSAPKRIEATQVRHPPTGYRINEQRRYAGLNLS